MKFLHLGDLHLGKRLVGVSLLEDQRHILEEILSIAGSERPDAVLIAGDVYDRTTPARRGGDAAGRLPHPAFGGGAGGAHRREPRLRRAAGLRRAG